MLAGLEINKKNLEKNLEKIRTINKNIICVLKDDAYGLGIGNVLPILLENQCDYFAVAYVSEAVKIRKILKNLEEKKSELVKNKKIQVIMLNYVEVQKLKIAIKNDVEITIFNIHQLTEYTRMLDKCFENCELKVHIKVNTGMNRLGFDEDEILELIEKIEKYNNSKGKRNNKLKIISIFSHISDAENQSETERQVEKYEKILKIFDKSSINYIYRHIQASPLLFKYAKKYNYDFARIGMAIYGMEPLSCNVGLYDVVTVKSKIINIRNVKKNDKISYGDKGTVSRNSKIGIVSIGYAHGLQKQIENSGRAYVLVNGQKARILGEICMDMIFIDLTDIKNVEINDEVVIIGSQKNSENGIEEKITLRRMAEWTGTIQDDVLTKFGVIKKQ